MILHMISCDVREVEFKGEKIDVGIYKNKNKNKKDVLFLHGLGSNTLDSYSKTLDKLPQERICAIDWLGHGATTKLLRDKDSYGAEYMADYLKTVIDFLIDNDILDTHFFIVAMSMSAIPIAYLYPQYEKNIKKIVFLHPAGMDKKMGYVFAFFSKYITQNIFFSWFFSYWILNKKARRVLQKNLKVKNWGVIVSKYASEGYDLFGHMKETHYIPEKFNKIKKPVLLVCGERDMIFTRRKYLHFAVEHNWKVHILGKEEHALGRGNSDSVAEEIKNFFELV